jgi:hypothetical protein
MRRTLALYNAGDCRTFRMMMAFVSVTTVTAIAYLTTGFVMILTAAPTARRETTIIASQASTLLVCLLLACQVYILLNIPPLSTSSQVGSHRL